jgi:D-3-phosphoglycerate dehydrogenase
MKENTLKRSPLYKQKIAITTASFAEYDRKPVAILEESGAVCVANTLKRKLDPSEIVTLCDGCIGIIAGTEDYDRACLQKLSGLKVISRVGVGMDAIDIPAAKELGVAVVNTPDGPTLAVAELTVGLILDMMRGISCMDRHMRSGAWKKTMGNQLSKKRVGIVGFGRIGKAVAALLKTFDCELSYADPYVTESAAGLRRLGLSELLRGSDIVSIHVSGKGMVIGEKELELMKRGSWLVNVSRGGTVDEAALYQRLKDGRLAGAALDVFDREPYKGPILGLENVVLTPHIGSYAKESRVEMELQAVKNLIQELEGCR